MNKTEMVGEDKTQKPPTLAGFASTIVVSALVGSIPIMILASSENGYVAGYLILPLLFLLILACVILFICSIVFIVNEKFAIGLYLLISVFLVPAFTIGSGLAAKHFEIGAYRIEPMTPIIPPIANKIVFKKGVTDNEVQEFWRQVLSRPHPSGRGEMSLPGIQSIGTSPPEEGSEIIVFSFFSDATEEQKSYVRDQVTSSPKVQQLLENVDTTTKEVPTHQANTTINNGSSRKGSKVVISK